MRAGRRVDGARTDVAEDIGDLNAMLRARANEEIEKWGHCRRPERREAVSGDTAQINIGTRQCFQQWVDRAEIAEGVGRPDRVGDVRAVESFDESVRILVRSMCSARRGSEVPVPHVLPDRFLRIRRGGPVSSLVIPARCRGVQIARVQELHHVTGNVRRVRPIAPVGDVEMHDRDRPGVAGERDPLAFVQRAPQEILAARHDTRRPHLQVVSWG